MGFPDVTTEVAFATDPLAAPTWADVSQEALVASTSRGRQKELDRIEGGRAKVGFENEDRKFDNTYTSGPHYPNVVPMRRIRISALYNAVTYYLFSGYVTRWSPIWQKPSWSEVVAQCHDAFLPMAIAPVGTGAAWPLELSGARIGRALDAMGWPAGDRVLDAGQDAVDAVTFAEGDETSVLQHAMDVADSEVGYFFMDAQGRAVFHDRHHRLKPSSVYTPVATYGDGGGTELDYDEAFPDNPEERIVNDVRITPSGGAVIKVENATSITRFIRRTQQRTSLVPDVNACRSHAEYIVARYKDPQLRFDRLVLRPTAIADGSLQDSLWAQALGREIGDRVTVKARPPGGGNVISIDCHVEGIEHEIADQSWATTFYLSPADPLTYWLLGTAGFSELGQTTNLGP